MQHDLEGDDGPLMQLWQEAKVAHHSRMPRLKMSVALELGRPTAQHTSMCSLHQRIQTSVLAYLTTHHDDLLCFQNADALPQAWPNAQSETMIQVCLSPRTRMRLDVNFNSSIQKTLVRSVEMKAVTNSHLGCCDSR